MNPGEFVCAQLMQHLPLTTFGRCVARYRGEHNTKSFSYLDQFLSVAFAQSLIGIARPLYVNKPFGVDLDIQVFRLSPAVD